MNETALPLPTPPASPEEPVVPYDIPTPHGTIRAGVKLSVVIARMNVLYALLKKYQPVIDPSADEIEGWKIFFGDGSSKVYPTHYSIHHFTAMGMAAMPLYGRPLKDKESEYD